MFVFDRFRFDVVDNINGRLNNRRGMCTRCLQVRSKLALAKRIVSARHERLPVERSRRECPLKKPATNGSDDVRALNFPFSDASFLPTGVSRSRGLIAESRARIGNFASFTSARNIVG